MANGRNKLRKGDAGRDSGGFVALPWAVLDSPAYLSLSMHARALLLEVARQFVRDNNGRMLLSRSFMAGRGWKSCDMLDKAKRELLEAGFIFETVKGQRPNKAARYAVTWRALDRHPGYDMETVEAFQRGAYRLKEPVQIAPLVPPHGTEKNASLNPPHGHIDRAIVPPHGTGKVATVPPHGAIRGDFGAVSVPPHGHLSREPSTGSAATGVQDVHGVHGVHGGEGLLIATSGQDIASTEAVTRPRRHRSKHHRAHAAEGVPQPPDPTAQLELLLPVGGG